MSTLNTILTAFEPIALAGMDHVKLMDRVETKFAFAQHRLPLLLERLAPHYSILKQNGDPFFTYKTLYFDTSDLELYIKHHNGHSQRHKIRYRQYAGSNTGFLEVKLRTNKGRIIKERIRSEEFDLTWNAEALGFLRERTKYDPGHLLPSLQTSFERITLVNKAGKERITIDLNLGFEADATSRQMPNLAIAEIKQASRAHTPATECLKALKIKEAWLSKYCLGITQLYPHVKQNNFKARLNALNKAML